MRYVFEEAASNVFEEAASDVFEEAASDVCEQAASIVFVTRRSVWAIVITTIVICTFLSLTHSSFCFSCLIASDFFTRQELEQAKIKSYINMHFWECRTKLINGLAKTRTWNDYATDIGVFSIRLPWQKQQVNLKLTSLQVPVDSIPDISSKQTMMVIAF